MSTTHAYWEPHRMPVSRPWYRRRIVVALVMSVAALVPTPAFEAVRPPGDVHAAAWVVDDDGGNGSDA